MIKTGYLSSHSLQDFGYLLITDDKMQVTGVSERALKWGHFQAHELLGESVQVFLKKTVGKTSIGFMRIIEDLIDQRIPRQVVTKKLHNQVYYFKFTYVEGQVYVEWERQHKKHITASRMDELAFLFDQTYPSDWSMVCPAVNRLLGFDRVFVLQVMDSGHSRVVSSHATRSADSLDKKEFSKELMPPSAREYYSGASYRYVPQLHRKNQRFYALGEENMPAMSQFAPLPEPQVNFLKVLGVGAAIFFPLFLNGEFWGLLIAHNAKAKKVDLQTRKLCSFITQNAMSKYESQIRQGLLDRSLQIKKMEETLRKEILRQRTINCALVRHLDVLMKITHSDGLAIFHQGDLYFHGDCPKGELLDEIIHFLQQHTDKSIFKDYNFRRTHGHHFSEALPFAGLLAFSLKAEKDHYVVWFRKEVVSQVMHVDEEAGGRILDLEITDSALPWSDQDIMFVESLRRIINEALVIKSKERLALNQKLQSMNNELEMFTFTLSHDLRNPLSILGMGLQFLKSSENHISTEKKLEWYRNLLDSVQSIEDIISNIVALSQTKTNALTKDPIPMHYTIQKICREMALIHENENCVFHYGTLYPIWGEKSALYQVFLNLIGNAVKYASRDRQTEVWVESSVDDHAVHYIVKDNGIGIPPESIPHVYEMFSRADNAQQYQGTGVGLSLVKRIMDRLGGNIQIRSEVDKGTEISISFPMVSEFPPSMLREVRV